MVNVLLHFGRSALRAQLEKLFPQDEPRPFKASALLFALFAVVVGAAVSLGRTTGAGPFQTIWEEDARDLLSDALTQPFTTTLIKPYVGYFQVGPRILAETATFFPISWAAAVLSIGAALVGALLALAVYIASSTHLRHPLARFLASAPMLFSPTAENWVSEIYNRPATIQFFLVYAVFWLLIWRPASWLARLVQAFTIGIAAISTFLVVLLIPLAVARLWACRDRLSLLYLGYLSSGLVLQMAGLYFGLTDRSFVSPRYNPLWAIKNLFLWAVPHSMLGWNHAAKIGDEGLSVSLDQLARIAVAWVIVIAALLLALYRFTRPLWLLAGAAAVHAAAILCVTIMSNGMITQRYLLPVELLLFTALAALLIPSGRSPKALAPLALLTCFVIAISATNYRHHDTWRHKGPVWTEQLKIAARECASSGKTQLVVRSGAEPYYSLVTVPCRLLLRRN